MAEEERKISSPEALARIVDDLMGKVTTIVNGRRVAAPDVPGVRAAVLKEVLRYQREGVVYEGELMLDAIISADELQKLLDAESE